MVLGFFFFGVGLSYDDEREKRAMELFSLGEYSLSKGLYEELFNEKTTLFSKETALYNMGCAAVAQRDWGEALQLFNKISLEGKLPPKLKRNLFANKALAILCQVEQLYTNAHNRERPAIEEYKKAIVSLKEVSTLLEKAMDMDEYLAKLRGGREEGVLEDLVRLKLEMKNLLMLLFQECDSYKIGHISFEECLEYLQEHLHKEIDHLDILGQEKRGEGIQNDYLEYASYRGKRLEPVWEALHNALLLDEEEGEGDDYKQRLFIDAEGDFAKSRAFMQEKRLWDSRKSLASSKGALDLLSVLCSGKDAMGYLLQERISLFLKLKGVMSEEKRRVLEEEATALYCLITLMGQMQHEEIARRADCLEGRLTLILFDKLCFQMKEKIPSLKDLYADQIFYKGAFEKEEETLAAIYEQSFKSLLDKSVSQDLVDSLFLHLLALREKFTVRFNLEAKVDVKGKISRILQILEIEEKLCCEAFLRDIWKVSAEALQEWFPRGFILKKLEGVLQRHKEDRRVISVEVLEEVEKEISDILPLAEKFKGEEGQEYLKLNESLSCSMEGLKWSKCYVEKEAFEEAQFFLKSAMYWIKNALSSISEKKDCLKEFLKGVLQRQLRAIEDNLLIHRLGDGEEFIEVLRQLQNDVFEEAQGFAQAKARLSKEERDSLPLEEIVKLYDKGEKKAKEALSFLRVEKMEREFVLHKQRRVMQYWQEALDKLLGRENILSLKGSELEKEQEEYEEGAEGHHRLLSSKKEFRGLLNMLQEMHRDDRVRKRRSLPARKGIRAW